MPFPTVSFTFIFLLKLKCCHLVISDIFVQTFVCSQLHTQVSEWSTQHDILSIIFVNPNQSNLLNKSRFQGHLKSTSQWDLSFDLLFYVSVCDALSQSYLWFCQNETPSHDPLNFPSQLLTSLAPRWHSFWQSADLSILFLISWVLWNISRHWWTPFLPPRQTNIYVHSHQRGPHLVLSKFSPLSWTDFSAYVPCLSQPCHNNLSDWCCPRGRLRL